MYVCTPYTMYNVAKIDMACRSMYLGCFLRRSTLERIREKLKMASESDDVLYIRNVRVIIQIKYGYQHKHLGDVSLLTVNAWTWVFLSLINLTKWIALD